MNILVDVLGERELEFGNGECDKDPKRMLPLAGPFGSSEELQAKTLQLGLVGLPDEIDLIRRWIDRMSTPLLNQSSNALRERAFPGIKEAFRCRLEIPDQFIRRINQRQYDLLSTRRPHDRFSELLKLYSDCICTLYGDYHPDCILVCFPEELANLRITNPRLTYQEQRF